MMGLINTGKCMFYENHTNLSIACDECWFFIASENVASDVVFGFGNKVTDEEIAELKHWTKTGNDF